MRLTFIVLICVGPLAGFAQLGVRSQEPMIAKSANADMDVVFHPDESRNQVEIDLHSNRAMEECHVIIKNMEGKVIDDHLITNFPDEHYAVPFEVIQHGDFDYLIEVDHQLVKEGHFHI